MKSSDYYYNAVLWAVKNHITSGTSTTTYSPNDPCTRGQMATFLWRYAKSPAVSTTESFTDIPSNAYYTESVAWAKANSIAAGVGDGKYAPEESCTRGQMVVFLQRLDGYLGE